MAILVDTDTKLVVQGLTGREGSFHGLRNREYGTDLVAGGTPGKAGQEGDGVPVFDAIREAVDELGGAAGERSAERTAASVTRPVGAYMAASAAPPGKQMGHAGPIISGSQG